MESLNLAIDLDGCCCRFVKAMADYINVCHGTNIKPEQWTKWNGWEVYGINITREQWMQCFEEFTRNRMWQAVELFDGAKEALVRLHEDGHKIYYFTDRPEGARFPTLKYITSNGLPVDGIFFSDTKSTVAVGLSIDLALDDKPENITDYLLAGINSVLMLRPYNSFADFVNKRSRNRIFQVSDMPEFYRFVKDYSKEVNSDLEEANNDKR